MLGEAQWAWLEEQLAAAAGNAELVLIGGGLQFVSTGKTLAEGFGHSFEDPFFTWTCLAGWKNFPRSRERLWKLLARCV